MEKTYYKLNKLKDKMSKIFLFYQYVLFTLVNWIVN